MSETVQEIDGSYSQWVRRIVARKGAPGGMIPLFESSVPEPRELLTRLVAEAFASPVTDRYTSAFARGNPFVVEALCRHYGVSPANILCTTGASSAISLLYRALVGEGEEILVETPGFDLFQDLARQAGIAFRTFPRIGGEFALHVEEIERRLRPETRLVILSNLHNPSGWAVSHPVMLELAALADRKNLTVVVDEVYGDYASPEARPVHAAALSRRLVSVSSLTKNFGLSTLRCGWMIADPGILDAVRLLAGRTEFGVSNLAHAAAALVLERREPFLEYSGAIVARARSVIEPYFEKWRAEGLIEGRLPPFGCVCFPRLVGVENGVAFADWLAERSDVVVAPGEYFGAPGHVRLGFGFEPGKLDIALSRLDEGLRAYSASVREVARA
jgi:aspartate/methionine/tyrosine aminotransferase